MEGYVKTYVIDVNTAYTPEEGAHSPSWPNGLIISIITTSLDCCSYCLAPERFQARVELPVGLLERLLSLEHARDDDTYHHHRLLALAALTCLQA
jgi:hypothetical protein